MCDLRRLTEAQIKVFVTTVVVQSTIKAESFWPVQFQTISVLQLRGRVKIVLTVQCLFPCSLSVYTGCTICELLSMAYKALSNYGSSEVFSKTLSQHLVRILFVPLCRITSSLFLYGSGAHVGLTIDYVVVKNDLPQWD